MEKFKVGVSSDILDSRGEPAFGREPLKALEHLQWEWLPKGLREITADHAAAYDALYVNSPKVPAAAVARADLRLKLISRHGVGYDSVDVPAMTRAGLENVEAIAAVDGVDVIWLGHFDLTNFLGIPGQFSHPQYRDAVKRIAAAAKKHGKSAGYMAASQELGREFLDHGYRMIATGTDQALLQNSLSQLIGSWKKPSA